MLVCGRKLEHPKETHVDAERTNKIRIEKNKITSSREQTQDTLILLYIKFYVQCTLNFTFSHFISGLQNTLKGSYMLR